MKMKPITSMPIGRRAIIRGGTLFLATSAISPTLPATESLASDSKDGDLKFGLVTDLHYADKEPRGTRHYRQTLDKLAEASEHFKKQQLGFVVELGDLIDSADSVKAELGHLKRINREFSRVCPNRHYVLGNHCVHTLTKQEFLGGVGQAKSYYSFDSGGFHFVVLDACFRNDGQPYGRKNFVWTDPNIPAAELDWLREDLKATKKQTIVFAHQRLDVSNQHGVKNALDVRQVMEESGKVKAVFQGHSHKNDHNDIGGIHYCTMVAMVEGSGADNNGYSVIRLSLDGAIMIDGFRNQADYAWAPPDALLPS